MSDEHDQDYQTEDEPAIKADTHSLGDLQLAPLTPLRFAAAQSIGMRWPIDKDEYRQDGGLYRGELMDAVICLWLCTLPENPEKGAEWNVKRALGKPDAAQLAALKWGSEKGISVPNSDAFWEAINTFEKMILEINSAYTAPKGSTPKD